MKKPVLCQEVIGTLGAYVSERHLVRCGQPEVGVVWHQKDLRAALEDAIEALDQYSDVKDSPEGEPVPNRAMSAKAAAEEALR